MTSQTKSSVGSYAIPQDEFNRLLAFTRTDTFQARRDRTSEYFRADRTNEFALKMLKHGGLIVGGCTLGGVVIGGSVAGPQGALIGLGGGLGTGLLVSAIYGGVTFHQDYEDWKNSYEDRTVVNRFIQIHDQLPAFQGLICPISNDIIKEPVQLSCGHTFEKTMIEDWHDQKVNTPDGAKCPECRAFFSKTQLTPDITYVGKIKKVYSNVLKNEMQNPLFSPEIVKGFEAVHKGLNFQSTEILKQVSTDLTLQLHNGDLTPQAFSRKMREVTEIFSNDEEEVLPGKTNGQIDQKR